MEGRKELTFTPPAAPAPPSPPLQSGGGLSTVKDLHQKGKEINRVKRRAQVSKKVGRTEKKMNELKSKEDMRDM